MLFIASTMLLVYALAAARPNEARFEKSASFSTRSPAPTSGAPLPTFTDGAHANHTQHHSHLMKLLESAVAQPTPLPTYVATVTVTTTRRHGECSCSVHGPQSDPFNSSHSRHTRTGTHTSHPNKSVPTETRDRPPSTKTDTGVFTTATSDLAYTTLARVRRDDSTTTATTATSSTATPSCTSTDAHDCTPAKKHKKEKWYQNDAFIIIMSLLAFTVFFLAFLYTFRRIFLCVWNRTH
jgi:hypothetical protein